MNGSWSRKKIARGEAVPVEFTLEQRDLILGRHQGNIPLAPLVDEETFQDALETIKLNIRIKPSDVWGAVFQPYPGTECGKYAVEQGYCKNLDVDQIKSDFAFTNTSSTYKKQTCTINIH